MMITYLQANFFASIVKVESKSMFPRTAATCITIAKEQLLAAEVETVQIINLEADLLIELVPFEIEEVQVEIKKGSRQGGNHRLQVRIDPRIVGEADLFREVQVPEDPDHLPQVVATIQEGEGGEIHQVEAHLGQTDPVDDLTLLPTNLLRDRLHLPDLVPQRNCNIESSQSEIKGH